MYLDTLEDSQLQIMRLGESNIRHLEDSDPGASPWTFQGIAGPTKCCKTQCFEEIAQIVFPWTEDCSFPKQHFAPFNIPIQFGVKSFLERNSC